MDEDLKWILIAIVVMFFISRIFDVAGVTSASSRTQSVISGTKSSTSQKAQVKNQIITTKVLDAYGNVVQTKEVQY